MIFTSFCRFFTAVSINCMHEIIVSYRSKAFRLVDFVFFHCYSSCRLPTIGFEFGAFCSNKAMTVSVIFILEFDPSTNFITRGLSLSGGFLGWDGAMVIAYSVLSDVGEEQMGNFERLIVVLLVCRVEFECVLFVLF